MDLNCLLPVIFGGGFLKIFYSDASNVYFYINGMFYTTLPLRETGRNTGEIGGGCPFPVTWR